MTRPLQVLAQDGKTPLTPAQQRFNTLVRQVAQARDTLGTWQAAIQTFRSAYAQRVAPLEAQLDDERRRWVLTLDALSRQDGWSRAELDTMSTLIGDIAFGLLLAAPEDAALRALHAEHAGVDFERALAAARTRHAASVGDGRGEGPDEDDADADARDRGNGSARDRPKDAQSDDTSPADAPVDDTAWEWTHPAEQARAHVPPRRRSAAERRRDADARQATQSVREVYRKLASALHPDREPDPERRDAKTALMQQANRAHEAGDLLALLELQWQLAQIDLHGLAGAGTQRLKQYNAVLTEQLENLKTTVADVERGFRREFALSPDVPLHPGKLEAVVRALRAEVHESVQGAKHDRALLADRAWVRQWLKDARRR